MSYQQPFENDEYRRRIDHVKKRMEAQDFEVLICQDPANMCWLTGFNGWSFYTPQVVIVHLEEEWPIWFGRFQDAESAHVTTVLPAENILYYSEPLLHHREHHPYDEMCGLFVSRGWDKARIGVELDTHYYTARAHQHLVKGLPNARFSDCLELVNWAKSVKSEAELVYMRQAGQITTEVMKQAIAKCVPGTPMNEIAAEIYRAQVTGLDGLWGDYTSICPLIQVGEASKTPHLTWTGEKLPADGPIVLEIAAARHHYHAPLTRTLYLGKPPRALVDLAKVIVEGGNAAIEAARVGSTCEDVEAVYQTFLRKNGYEKKSRVGYSIGLNFPPDWGERTMSLRSGDKTVLEHGMCFHFQSGVWLDNFGAAISESIVVTENGGERLCNIARELITLD